MIALLVPAGCLTAIAAIVWHDYRGYKREVEQARARTAAERQERTARLALHPHTGHVTAAPRVVPLVDCLPFPDYPDTDL